MEQIIFGYSHLEQLELLFQDNKEESVQTAL